ncbi:MAG: tetratricopeptide repeat protein, partial [Planctomycetota bacterium]
MMCVQDKEVFKMIAVWLVMLVCLFVTGCRDKPAATDHYDRGQAHYLDGEYDQAFSELTRAIEIDPGLARAYVTRGIAYNDKDKFDLAIADFSKVIEIEPT